MLKHQKQALIYFDNYILYKLSKAKAFIFVLTPVYIRIILKNIWRFYYLIYSYHLVKRIWFNFSSLMYEKLVCLYNKCTTFSFMAANIK